ncbi:unnamed protein product [Caenorhabditis bovis]|uniref:Uncharacterized protein n=1 Tax=Caenorhabditis bovis TaxID=2654633 RepID=A0A8S1FFS8_9PELO|nr:unnamed protein product [Caenorhabditis bovis]
MDMPCDEFCQVVFNAIDASAEHFDRTMGRAEEHGIVDLFQELVRHYNLIVALVLRLGRICIHATNILGNNVIQFANAA